VTASGLLSIAEIAKKAIGRRDWQTLEVAASKLCSEYPNEPETFFVTGVLARARGQYDEAQRSFEHGLTLAPERYDLAVELASLYGRILRHGEAFTLLNKVTSLLCDSPLYCDMAGSVLIGLGMPDRALPLAQRAHELQPEVDVFAANLAHCLSFVGKHRQSAELYTALLLKNPNHRRNHYALARVQTALDTSHIEQMNGVMANDPAPENRNIPLFFAQGKEYEDLGLWIEAYKAYEAGCNAVRSIRKTGFHQVLSRLRQTAGMVWRDEPALSSPVGRLGRKTPLFIVGLPRTGSTLLERVLTNHTQVTSLGETRYFEMAMKQVFGSVEEAMAQLSKCDSSLTKAVATRYLEAVQFRLKDCRFFIDKLPLNFNFVPAIASAFPEAKFIYVSRAPEATCWSMYKQLFMGEYVFSYDQQELGQYFCAHDRYRLQFSERLGDRWLEIGYEALVTRPDEEIPALLGRLDLPEEETCLAPHRNPAPSMTASSVQIREPIHQNVLSSWRHFEAFLEPLMVSLGEHARDQSSDGR
jgi:tetratricopeptide (TPR) repeat protein